MVDYKTIRVREEVLSTIKKYKFPGESWSTFFYRMACENKNNKEGSKNV